MHTTPCSRCWMRSWINFETASSDPKYLVKIANYLLHIVQSTRIATNNQVSEGGVPKRQSDLSSDSCSWGVPEKMEGLRLRIYPILDYLGAGTIPRLDTRL
jgi:hypothetical protein